MRSLIALVVFLVSGSLAHAQYGTPLNGAGQNITPATISATGNIIGTSSITTTGGLFGDGFGITDLNAANLTGVIPTGSATTLTALTKVTSAVTFTSTASLLGSTNGGNATAGYVGEYISTTPVANRPPPSSSTVVTLATTTLSAGDWMVQGYAHLTVGGSLAATGYYVCVSLNSNNCDGPGPSITTTITGATWDLEVPTSPRRINVTANTAVYLNAYLTYSNLNNSTWSAAASLLQAWRIR